MGPGQRKTIAVRWRIVPFGGRYLAMHPVRAGCLRDTTGNLPSALSARHA